MSLLSIGFSNGSRTELIRPVLMQGWRGGAEAARTRGLVRGESAVKAAPHSDKRLKTGGENVTVHKRAYAIPWPAARGNHWSLVVYDSVGQLGGRKVSSMVNGRSTKLEVGVPHGIAERVRTAATGWTEEAGYQSPYQTCCGRRSSSTLE